MNQLNHQIPFHSGLITFLILKIKNSKLNFNEMYCTHPNCLIQMHIFNTQHTGTTTVGRLKPLFPHIQRLMDDDDDTIKTVMRTITRVLGREETQLMDTQGMENLISLYIRERDLAILGE